MDTSEPRVYGPRAVVKGPPTDRTATSWRLYLILIVPAVGLLEFGAHLVQIHSGPRDDDWRAAKTFIESQVKPDDLVAVAPRWAEPLAGMHLGPELLTMDRAARPDESRFPRALEVNMRGAHLPAFAGWAREGEQRFGDLAVTTWRNPSPAHVIVDLVAALGPQTAAVSYVDGDREAACPYGRGSPISGGLGFGPTIPAERFDCRGRGMVVGVTIVADLDYHPRRCIYAPAPSRGALRIRFSNVRFGTVLHGFHGLDAEAERHRQGADVTLKISAGDTWTSSVIHRDGEGWKAFELGTDELAGKTEDLIFEVASPGGEGRKYCFTADTR